MLGVSCLGVFFIQGSELNTPSHFTLQKHFCWCSLLYSQFWDATQHTPFLSQNVAAAKVRTDEPLSNYINFVGVCGQMILWYATPSNPLLKHNSFDEFHKHLPVWKRLTDVQWENRTWQVTIWMIYKQTFTDSSTHPSG